MHDQLNRIEKMGIHNHAMLHAVAEAFAAFVAANDPGGRVDQEVAALIDHLKTSADALRGAMPGDQGSAQSSPNSPDRSTGEVQMNPLLQALSDQVKANTDAEASAVLWINGSAARTQAAIDKALAGGATAAQLAPIQAEVDAMKQSADAIGAAIVANTPAA